MSVFEWKEIEFTRDHRHYGILIPAGTRVKCHNGVALTFVHRGHAKMIEPKGKRKDAAKLDHSAGASAE